MKLPAASEVTVVALVALLLASALSLVTAQHRARGVFVELERASRQASQLEADRNWLRIELGRGSQPAAVESAARRLGLKPVDGTRTVFLPMTSATTEAAR